MKEKEQTTSNESKTSRYYQEEEIDLRKLFEAIGDFFVRIWKGIIHFIVLVRRETLNHKMLFIILIVLGGILGFGSQKITKPYYKTSMLLNSSFFRGQLVEKTVEKLNILCNNEDSTKLATALGIPVDVAQKIRGFEAIPFVTEDEVIEVELLRQQLQDLNAEEEQINRVTSLMTLEYKTTNEIIVYVYDKNIVPQLEEPIVNYFSKNPFIRKRIEVTRQNRELKKNKLQQEARKLDSLKKVIYNNLSSLTDRTREGSNNVILAEDNITNPLSVFREDMNLYEQELELERQLTLEPELEVVDGFTISAQPEIPGTKTTTAYGIIIALSLGYLFMILKGINSYLIKVEKEEFS